MMQDIETTIKRAKIYDDSVELAEALEDLREEIIEAFGNGHTGVYYLRECSIHIESMHEDLIEAVRAIKVLQRQLKETKCKSTK